MSATDRSGLLVKANKPIRFSFEGREYTGLEGDTLASALLANGHWLVSRSFKYHRPRGPLSMAGQDANTLIQLGGEPNVLADREPLVEGLNAEGQNYSGTLEQDRDAMLGKLGRFMPVGFYYRSFFKPLGVWDKWESVIRKKAGLGTLDLDFKPAYYDKAYLFHDVVVVGAGPAGLAAALKAADAGADVLIVEEQPYLGGALAWHRFDAAGTQAAETRALLMRVEQHERIRILSNATCNAWFADNYLPVIQGQRLYKVRARQCIVASGAFEQHVVFHNNDLPGVVLCSAAERMMALYGIKPGERAVVLSGNDEGYSTALALAEFGVDVTAVVDLRAQVGSIALRDAVRRKGIPVKMATAVYEAIGGGVNGRVTAVELRAITAPGSVAESGERLACDLVCMSAGYMPSYQLLCQAGAQLKYDDASAAFSLSKLPANLHVAGSVNGIFDLPAVIADGERAAAEALGLMGLEVGALPEVVCTSRPNYPWPIFPHPGGKEFVDFDEDLQAKDIINATRLGYRDVQLVKRFSTVGMGPSQGRHSALPTARLIAKATNRSVTETGVTTARPPYAPEKMAHNAGRIFSPYRRTAMHHRHLALGAKMVPVGDWQRPAFYGDEAMKKQCIEAEALHVRSKVGLIDVSTLGGIELRGPDAAEMMNRMYTFAFLKQPVGRTRYAVMTNEHGVVIDDGVACRLADDHFYVTATTSGVSRVYRAMTQWNAQWRLDVDITNVTSAFAAVNLAGPDSRKVLEKLTDIDLSADGFPYLASREGHVANIPARLMRVGFVGELGYEIHVPSRYGEALWDGVMEAGAEFGIKPFGVDTQRLLRLEKGHIIVGQDSDGMSHPGELSLAWAVNRKKPFYVGCRSVDIMMRNQRVRHLVAFSLEKSSPQPKEGHLVLNGDDVAGSVTSCEYSPTLDRIIGFAYASSESKAPGAFITIRTDGGVLVQATVVPPAFYDPEQLRQEM